MNKRILRFSIFFGVIILSFLVGFFAPKLGILYCKHPDGQSTLMYIASIWLDGLMNIFFGALLAAIAGIFLIAIYAGGKYLWFGKI